jgi:hypothetical protein
MYLDSVFVFVFVNFILSKSCIKWKYFTS